jgi:CheY-like chemotaxis protein/Tfp pilus assembly protein PilZ
MPSDKTIDRTKKLLFVVDSDGAYLYYTGVLLQRLEYILHTIKTAEEALELINVALPSLILTDAELPRMSCTDFLKQLKLNPKTQAIPVIVYALSNEPALREACLREGAVAFLKKPLDAELLYATIQKATEATPRGFVRLTTCLPVVAGAEQTGGSDPEARVTALSEHGAYVNTDHPQPKGAHVPLTIQLENVSVRVEGKVLYSFDRTNSPLRTPGMGVQFTRIRPEDESVIKNFIEEQLTKDLSRPGRG